MVTDLRKAADDAIEALEIASSFVDAYYLPKGKAYLPVVEAAITALREALAKPDVPPGYALVPVEPTPEMVAAAGATPGMRAIDAASTLTQIRSGRPLPGTAFDDGAPLVQAYRAMLAAAPQPKDKQ